MTAEVIGHANEDIWQGITQANEQGPKGCSGVWMQHVQFETLMREHDAIWNEVSSAFSSVNAKPRVFVGRRGETIEFLLLHHTLSAELGIWLAPTQRGKGRAAAWLKAGLVIIDWSLNPLLLATCPDLKSPSAGAFIEAGFRILAEQEQQVVLCLYRPQKSG